MSMNWLPTIELFSGKIVPIPEHLQPLVTFDDNTPPSSEAICPLTNILFLSVKGQEAESFLQGQLTCDMREINANTTKLSGHCNPKGRLHGVFYVFQLETNHYCLGLPINQLEHIQTSLKKYVLFSKVVIQPISLYSFGLIGQKSAFDKIDIKLTTLNLFEKYEINSNIYIRIPCHDSEYLRFMVIINPGEENPTALLTPFWQKMNALGFGNLATTEWHKFNLLALLPSIYPETTEKYLPHHLNLPQLGAVSFKKGCYTGQEIVARMEYLGNIKKSLSCQAFQPETIPPKLEENNLIDYTAFPGLKGAISYLGLFISSLDS